MFIPRNRKQYCCSRPECQKARKTNWQRIKMKTDPDYRAAQKLSNQKWAGKKPGYWKTYLELNPEEAERNRMLQTIRTVAGQLAKNPMTFRLQRWARRK
jgi:hypothetical protein